MCCSLLLLLLSAGTLALSLRLRDAEKRPVQRRSLPHQGCKRVAQMGVCQSGKAQLHKYVSSWHALASPDAVEKLCACMKSKKGRRRDSGARRRYTARGEPLSAEAALRSLWQAAQRTMCAGRGRLAAGRWKAPALQGRRIRKALSSQLLREAFRLQEEGSCRSPAC